MQLNLEVLRLNLQHSLVKLQMWCKQNGMVFSAENKIMLITIRKKRVRLNENLFCLTYNDIDLQLTTGDKHPEKIASLTLHR